jgi:hypothetical protein
MDGLPTPVLVVERGVEYTFNIATTALHPFYIVDNEFGGEQEGETIYAGGASGVIGTLDEPGTLKWTPDDSTPDLVYYQCTAHAKLGWKIVVGGNLPAKQCSPLVSTTTTTTTTGDVGSSSTTPATSTKTTGESITTTLSGTQTGTILDSFATTLVPTQLLFIIICLVIIIQ